MPARRLRVVCFIVVLGLTTAGAQETSAAADAPSAASPVPRADPAQCQLLLAFKSTLANGKEVLPTWTNGTDCCAWQGISCSPEGFISRMALIEFSITAKIPQPDGWVLPNRLQALELGLNNITGPIPAGWKLPPTLITLYFDNNPLGGSLSPDWALPDTLNHLLLRNCSLTGPLPTGRPLPAALQAVSVNDNRLMGTIPWEFTQIAGLKNMELQNNLLTGPIPPNFTFNNSSPFQGLVLLNNSLSGPVPSWPMAPTAQVEIYPGNEGLCGELPSSPTLFGRAPGGIGVVSVTSLPPCSPSTGTVVGATVGAVSCAAIAVVGAVWVLQRRRRHALRARQVGPDGKTGKLGSDMEQGSGGSTAPTKPPTSIDSQMMVSLFTLDGKGSSGGGGSGGVSSSGRTADTSGLSRVSLTEAGVLLRGSSSSGSASSGISPPGLQARLDELQAMPPAWLISPARLVLETGNDGQLVLLGEGAFGRVYRGWLWPEGKTAERQPVGAGAATDGRGGPPVAVALKVMEVGHLSAFLKEADIMYRLSHNPHMVMLHGACIVGQQLVVVMELMEAGDLATALLIDNDQALTWQQHGKQIALDIAAGLTYLHDNNITHRDLKSRNVLLTKDLRAKVSDVGTAAIHSATYLSAGSSNFMGTLAWAAPELLLGSPCTKQIDIYSMGVCLWEIVARQVPKRGCVAPPPVSDDCPAGLADLIHDCLQLDPKQRPTAQQVLERLQQL